MTTLTSAPFDASHIPGALALSRAAHWPHRAEDWALFLSLSRGAVVQDGEDVVATALATPFGPVATANMIIVDAGRRGAGLGRQVMEAAMAQVAAQEWRLIATTDGLPLYRKLGFVAVGEIVQHQGVVTAGPAGAMPDRATAADLAALAALDTAASGMARGPLFEALLRLGTVHVLREGGAITALAALRPFGRGEVLGPVVARNADEARAIMAPIVASAAGRFLRVDTPVTSGLAGWLAAQGMTHAGGGIQMRRGGGADPAGPQQVFALAAQALG
ncbi:MAG: GNAT family N-acetyltransferase [Rhodobacteraceae bacterium]|nr:GNAT family N-acetyltransferase [Paracoccaceae bacterium]